MKRTAGAILPGLSLRSVTGTIPARSPLIETGKGRFADLPKQACIPDCDRQGTAISPYFGHNWDAFYDCLLELKHGEGAGTLLGLKDTSGFARAEPEEFAAAVGALADAADYWKSRNAALLVVFELDVAALAPELAEISCPAA